MIVFDRDAAREVFDRWDYDSTHLNELLDALEACVRPIVTMKWQVVGSDGFVYAQFAYSVDALEYKAHAPEDVREHLNIGKIGE